MIKKIFVCLVLILNVLFSYTQEKDSVQFSRLKNQIEQLDNALKEVRRDELNYKIEKDLIKETYSNNYERISLVITIVLGIIGLFGYLGLKDINTIKKEYTTELLRLNELKTELENKIRLISDTQIKYEKEILEIIKQNEEQNVKIRTLEALSKISKLRNEKKYAAALEECLNALNADPNSVQLLLEKSLIYSITHSFAEAVHTYIKVLELEPDNTTAILNLSEAYVLNNQNEKSDQIILDNKSHFNGNNGKQALNLLRVIKNFNIGNIPALKAEIKKQIDLTDLEEMKDRFENWNLDESTAYVEQAPNSVQKQMVKNYFDYSAGKINGSELSKRLDTI